MIASQLRASAETEANDLGPEPPSRKDRSVWLEELRGAIELLAALADWDGTLLRRAALGVASESTGQHGRELLIEAAKIADQIGPIH
jgi:hypothetical protein